MIYPDVHVAALPATKLREPSPGWDAGVALMEPVIEVANPLPDQAPQLSVEIRDVAQRRLVTLIEILSPANKHSRGALEYHDRRIELLQTRTHLLEIDLLRGGTRIQLLAEPPAAPYYVYLSRTERRPYTQIWPVDAAPAPARGARAAVASRPRRGARPASGRRCLLCAGGLRAPAGLRRSPASAAVERR